MQISTLWVGCVERAEFRHVLPFLHRHAPLATVPDVPSALARLHQFPQVRQILLAPSYRDEFRPGELLQLVQRQPLAEIVILVGPWLEGETRSGHPWWGAERLYLDQVIPWLSSRRRPAGASGPGTVPWRPATLSPEEAWQLAAEAEWPGLRGQVLICSELPEARRYLQDLCVAAGLATAGFRPDQRIEWTGRAAVIYDAVANRRAWTQHVEQLAQRYRPSTLVVLMNFPRPDEIEFMQRAGATGILGKPFRVDHLLRSLKAPPATVRLRARQVDSTGDC